MKKASKLLWVLLAVMLASVLVIGCSNGSDDDDAGYKTPISSSTTFKTYYIKVLDSSRDAPWNDISATNRVHLHVPKGVGFKIQKLFTSNTMSEGVPSDAVVWYDFTKGNDAADYETGNYGGSLDNGTVGSGAWTLDNSAGTGQVYAGNMGIAMDGRAYIGFVMANVSGTAVFDNLQLEFRYGNESASSYGSKPCFYYFNLTPPQTETPDELNLTEWTPAYLVLNAGQGANKFMFHANAGHVEIQKVYVNTTKSLTGALLVIDLTDNAIGITAPYWNHLNDGSFGTTSGVGTSDGKFVLHSANADDYVGGDAFASGAAWDAAFASPPALVWIFIIKTTSEGVDDLGATRVQCGLDDSGDFTSFGEYFFNQMSFVGD